jgi:Fe2+ transport system protein B
MSLVLVGNKIDLNDKREVSIDDINKFSQERKIKYFETSAKNNIGIEEMMNYIVKKTLKIIKKRNDENNEENITILSFDQKEKKGCC